MLFHLGTEICNASLRLLRVRYFCNAYRVRKLQLFFGRNDGEQHHILCESIALLLLLLVAATHYKSLSSFGGSGFASQNQNPLPMLRKFVMQFILPLELVLEVRCFCNSYFNLRSNSTMTNKLGMNGGRLVRAM